MSWFGKQSPHLASGDEVTSKKLFFYSIAFWLGLYVLGLIFLLDLDVTSDLKISIFSSWQHTQSFLYGLVVFAFFSVLVGFISALPAAAIQLIFKPQIESLYRRSWAVPKARLIIFKYAALFILIATNFIFVSLSLGAAPHYSRGRSAQPGIVATWSQFVYDFIYAPKIRKKGKTLIEQLTATNSAQAYVVMLPSSTLSQPDIFTRLRKEIGEPVPFFVNSNDLPSELVQILDSSATFYQSYSSPLLTQKALSTEKIDTSLITLVSLGNSKINIRLSPEFSVFENVLRDKQDNKKEPPVTVALKKRLAVSQPQLFLMMRLGTVSVFDDAWMWSNIVSENSEELLKLIQEQIQSAEKTPLAMVQLDELENIPPQIDNPLSRLRWQPISSLLEKQKIVSNVDEILTLLAQAVKKLNGNLFILPYPDLKNPKQVSWSFISLSATNLQKTALEEKNKKNLWMTTLDAGHFITNTIKDNPELEDTPRVASCQPIFYSNEKNDNNLVLQKAWNFVSLDTKPSYIETNFRFLFKSQSYYGIFCKNQVSELPPYRANGYIFQYTTDDVSSFKEKKVIKSLFKTQAQIVTDKKRNQNTSVSEKQNANSQQQNEYKNIRAYKVSEQDFRQFDISAVPQNSIEQVIKNFSEEISHINKEISRGQLYWD